MYASPPVTTFTSRARSRAISYLKMAGRDVPQYFKEAREKGEIVVSGMFALWSTSCEALTDLVCRST